MACCPAPVVCLLVWYLSKIGISLDACIAKVSCCLLCLDTARVFACVYLYVLCWCYLDSVPGRVFIVPPFQWLAWLAVCWVVK